MKKAYLINISGIVQGVGFRPFIYNLAKNLNLCGYVLNNSTGVAIHIEGNSDLLDKFIYDLSSNAPPLSKINNLRIHDTTLENYTSFKIEESYKSISPYIFISPDVCTCDDCKNDILDINNKRYLYPFTNCTNCGPRFSIIKDIPYDRKVTTMAEFNQCEECFEEYSNFTHRRFHAQPNCCPSCGPKLSILTHNGFDITNNITNNSPINSVLYNRSIFNFFADKINSGKIFALKSLTGFHLCCSPFIEDTVRLLRKRKNRPKKPFALMMKDIETVKKFCYVSETEEKLLLNKSRPIVLLKKLPKYNLSNEISPNNNLLGVMLPSTPLHILLFETTPINALIMTSGNLSGLPLEYKNNLALDNLKPFADYSLINNRDIFLPLDDSIIKECKSKEMIIRRSRGYAPYPIFLEDCNNILALGADMKNTFSISKENYIYISPHHGELINYECLKRFKDNLKHYMNIFELSPKLISCDLHPNYESSKLSENFNLPIIKVQHHHAHIASCLVDNNYTEKVIGVAFDGTGYGDDDCIWGSEFFICDRKEYKRVGHLDYIKFIGGDNTLRDVSKIALSYLYNLYLINSDKSTKNINISTAKLLDSICLDSNLELKDMINSLLERNYKHSSKLIFKLLAMNNLSYKSSSMGRLFDAVSSILGLCHVSTFEGEAAISLESILESDEISNSYQFNIYFDNYYLISPLEIISQILIDINSGISINDISLKFHSTIVRYIENMCKILREKYKINTIALSGGVFQNSFILNNSYNILKENSFEVLIHKDIPCNDGGISVGQIVIAKNNK